MPSISPLRLRRHARFNFGWKGSTVKGQTIAFRLLGVKRPKEKLGRETKSFGCQNKKLFARNKMSRSFLFWRDFNFLGESCEKAFSVSRAPSLSGSFWSVSRMVKLINYQKRFSSEKVCVVKWTLETDKIPFLSLRRAFTINCLFVSLDDSRVWHKKCIVSSQEIGIIPWRDLIEASFLKVPRNTCLCLCCRSYQV